jgi:hypothetical protein
VPRPNEGNRDPIRWRVVRGAVTGCGRTGARSKEVDTREAATLASVAEGGESGAKAGTALAGAVGGGVAGSRAGSWSVKPSAGISGGEANGGAAGPSFGCLYMGLIAVSTVGIRAGSWEDGGVTSEGWWRREPFKTPWVWCGDTDGDVGGSTGQGEDGEVRLDAVDMGREKRVCGGGLVEGVQPFACLWRAELLTTSLVSKAGVDRKVDGCITGWWGSPPLSLLLWTLLLHATYALLLLGTLLLHATFATRSVTGSSGDGPWWEALSSLVLSPLGPPPTS